MSNAGLELIHKLAGKDDQTAKAISTHMMGYLAGYQDGLNDAQTDDEREPDASSPEINTVED
jgi:hypothetical protein